MDAQEFVGRREAVCDCVRKLKEEVRGKTMTKEIAIREDMKSVERWENEGGRVSPLNHLWASLKRFKTEDNSREGQLIDAQKSSRHQPGAFSGFNVRRAV